MCSWYLLSSCWRDTATQSIASPTIDGSSELNAQTMKSWNELVILSVTDCPGGRLNDSQHAAFKTSRISNEIKCNLTMSSTMSR
jgi:hypothetical protein